jgi:hypothetical protein
MSSVVIAGDTSGTVTLDAPAVAGSTVLTLPATSGTLNTSGAVNVVPAGTAAAPAITTTGDTDTGIFFPVANQIAFTSGGIERMRIDSSGNVLMNTTRTTGSGQDAAWFTSSGTTVTMTFGDIGAGGKGIFQYSRTAGSILVRSAGTGGVTLATGATSWASASDENIKDIIEPIENGLEKVSTLRAVIGKYKDDEEGTRRAFLIAQDVQKVLPESISIINKGEDNEYLGLAYTDVIPLLVASIKELNAKVEAQAEQIKALQGAA